MVDLTLELGNAVLPNFNVPEGYNLNTYLKHLVYEGARKNYGRDLAAPVVERIEYELSVITKMDFSGLLPHRVGLHQPGAEDEHRRGSRAGLRRWVHRLLLPGHHGPGPPEVQPPLREVPEPRPERDAGHGPRFLRQPERRGHRLRAAEVRRRPREPDHHLQQDDLQGGGEGRGPGAQHPLCQGQ